MGKGKKVTAGFRYYFGIHMGLGRGPVDEIVEIKIGDRTAWTGSITGNSQVQISAYNLFGGDNGEGGVEGALDIMMGYENQTMQESSPRLVTQLENDNQLVPGFRGVATMFFDGIICAINPYPKEWSIRVRRILQGWDGTVWYPEKATIIMADGKIRAMNPAHILMECFTNRDWGRGLDIGEVDTAALRYVADVLYAEGFGMCFRWTRQDTINAFVQTVLDHIGAAMGVNRRTGQLTVTLIRDDYKVEDLPLFTYENGLLKIEDLETPALDTATNAIVIKYRDPITGDDMVTPAITNLGSVQTIGGTNMTTNEYFGIPTLDLAGRLGIRDLQTSMGMIKRMTCHFDHRAYNLVPGAVFRVNVPTLGIENLVLRAGKVTDSGLVGAKIAVTCLMDIFGLPANSFVEPQPPGWVKPDLVARPVSVRRLRELSYFDLYRNQTGGSSEALNSLGGSTGFLGALAQKPTGLALNYSLYTSTNGSNFEEQDIGDWVPRGVIGGAMENTPQDTTVALSSYTNFDRVEVGGVALVDDEEMVVISIDRTNNRVTLGRGCLDTVPAAHPAGSVIWFYEDYQAEDLTERSLGNVYARMVTHTSAQNLDLNQAPQDTLNIQGRVARPYPPGNVRVNGNRLPVDRLSGEVRLDWSHRDRTIQADQLYSQLYGSIGPEAGTTYTIEIRNENGSVIRTTTGVTGTTWTYTSAMQATDNSPGKIRIRLWAVRDGLASWQMQDFTLSRGGLGFNLGYNLGGA